jgi:hypothetical protein
MTMHPDIRGALGRQRQAELTAQAERDRLVGLAKRDQPSMMRRLITVIRPRVIAARPWLEEGRLGAPEEGWDDYLAQLEGMRYPQYRQTPHWRRLAELVKHRDGYRCVLCNASQDTTRREPRLTRHDRFGRTFPETHEDSVSLNVRLQRVLARFSSSPVARTWGSISGSPQWFRGRPAYTQGRERRGTDPAPPRIEKSFVGLTAGDPENRYSISWL